MSTDPRPTFGRFPGPPGPRIVLACDGCDETFTASRPVYEHTWNEHGRMPTRAERTPR